jgi:hypothetical protein
MTRTQIQLPDELYDRAKRLAAAKEVSLAELVRRGLEYVIAIHPLGRPPRSQWNLEPPADSGLLRDPFANPDWRVEANLSSGATGAGGLLLNDRPQAQP